LSSQVTLNTVFQCLWGILLQKYNNTDDVVFGTVVSGRPSSIPGIESMVGLFINTVPVRVRANDNTTFAGLLSEVQEFLHESEKCQYLPLAEVQSVSELKNQLIDHITAFENYPVDKDVKDSSFYMRLGFNILNFEAEEQTNFDFDITIEPGEELLVRFTFNDLVYDREFAERVSNHLKELASKVIKDSDIVISQMQIITDEEKKQMLEALDRNKRDYDFSKPLHRIFEDWAETCPEKEAIIYEDKKINYLELNQKANRLGHYLSKAGIGTDDLVGVLLQRTPLMMEGIIGIWKAGGAYIPMDVKYPTERKLSILKDAQSKAVITLSMYCDKEFEEQYKGKIIKLDLIEEELQKESTDNLNKEVDISALAYCIFTSGSTGKPKGTMIEHLGMLNHIFAQREDINLDESLIFAQNANQCFDISVWQFFGSLVLGGTTAIYRDELVLEVNNFINRIIHDKVTLLEVVPSYLNVMMDFIEENSIKFDFLKYLIITGEASNPAIVKRWFKLCPGIRMVNAYGPAEASDDISQHIMDHYDAASNSVSIGKPLANIRIYILDRKMNLCPVGVTGEICVAGIAVGRGYINNPEKTAEVFVKDVYAKEEARLYKTGDLGRWLPDGNIEFFGRKDYQVKIRGFRIELGEIESKLAEHADIEEVAVIDREDAKGSKYLCAYFTSSRSIAAQELKEHLAVFLPQYMIPSHFMQLLEMPLSANGKIDRKGLPEPEENESSYIAPESDTEKALADIWREILGVERVGIDDNFFELGGHSLKASVLVLRIHRDLDVEMPLKQVFERPTIRGIAEYITKGVKGSYEVIEPVEKKDWYPLSSAQKRLYLLDLLEDRNSTSYNMTAVLHVEGRLDLIRLEETFKTLVRRHDAFRTCFGN
ncbi:MAG: amino acid adenylation domain-containing protein, partial [Clostridiaceae bacterium]|nr:amino acid adenylation domain-containing protein [Clostridiaceae bacterium]